MHRFERRLADAGLSLRRGRFQILQINVGRKCNQACRHCHVDAAPWRTEMMSGETAKRIAGWIAEQKPETVDITGGAPELNDQFPFLVKAAKAAGAEVIDRNNLTIIEEVGFEWLPGFLAENEVKIIASLPCYSASNVNQQRGNGVFDKSIAALRKLNALGYGTKLELDLVYNPLGPKLPGPQRELEADYKEALLGEFGIVFNRLFTITNQPIARFAEDLRKQGAYENYMELLVNSFNPETVEGLMCRNTLSVSHTGEVYDCDFNQMLGLRKETKPIFLWELEDYLIEGNKVVVGEHCFACTAGSGSSCSGAVL